MAATAITTAAGGGIFLKHITLFCCQVLWLFGWALLFFTVAAMTLPFILLEKVIRRG
jgi:hypothetical protein